MDVVVHVMTVDPVLLVIPALGAVASLVTVMLEVA
jgi:hypothetical protein